MKNWLLKSGITSVLFFASVIILPGQVPQGFNYMAIARDASYNVLPLTDLKVRIAILRTITPLDIEWEEEHSVTTNETGLFRLTVGDPEAKPVETGHAAFFSEIDWTIQPMYIRTSLYLEGIWTPVGDAQLLSVPYALVAGSSYSGVSNPFTMYGDTILFERSIDVVGDNLAMDEAIFEVKRNDGQTMFAVYNQGVRINVPLIDAVKGVKGGFAIGGFSGAKAGTVTNLFTLNKDSARIYIDKTPDLAKGAKGGFAVGGFDLVGKAGIQEYLTITPDSTRVYVKDSGKGAKGGFAVSGFGTKATPVNFLNITPQNYFIGHESGYKIQASGLYNSVIGYQAGKNLSTGGYNTMVGYNAGINTTSGNNNILMGNYAGNNLTVGIHNTLIGNSAGFSHTNQEFNVMIGTASGYHINASHWAGSFNTFVGINSGYQIRNSKENVFLGTNAGYWLNNGWGNTFIGIDAGRSRDESNEPNWPYEPGTIADYNTFIGDKSGYYINSGDNNVSVGFMAGFSNANGSGNVFLGNMAGSGETSSNKLYITNTNADPPLIYGDFSAKQLGINTKSLGKTLNVGGDASITGNLTAGSITAPVTGIINGLTMGKVFLTTTGNIVSILGGTFALNWEETGNWIEIINTNASVPCSYWYQVQDGVTTTGNSDQVAASANKKIIAGPNTPNKGFEIHFGQADGTDGWCSVWLQFLNGAMVGHYIKY